jgi:hypothetical protein
MHIHVHMFIFILYAWNKVNSFLVLLSSTLLKKNGFYSLHYLIIPLCTYQYCFYLIIHTNYSATTFCSYFNPYSTLHPPSFCSNISYAYNNSYIYMHTLTITLEFTLSHIPCHNFFFLFRITLPIGYPWLINQYIGHPIIYVNHFNNPHWFLIHSFKASRSYIPYFTLQNISVRNKITP